MSSSKRKMVGGEGSESACAAHSKGVRAGVKRLEAARTAAAKRKRAGSEGPESARAPTPWG